MKRFLALLALLAPFACAQTASRWEVGSAVLPTTATNICNDAPASSAAPACGGTQTLHLSQAVFVNTTGSAVTVTVTDNSTNCSGSVCTLFSASIAANTTYTISFGGARANQGVKWSASATGVNGWLAGY